MPYVIPTYTHWPVTINDATDVAAGVMSAADKAKLDALSETVFIFRPGGVDGENVYTNWATLHTATQNVQGSYVIQVDSTLAPAVVPVGTWDMGARATISPITPTTGSPPDPTNFANRLELADGAILRDVAAFRGPVAVYTNNTSGPALEITDNALTVLTDAAHIVHQGTQPVVSLTTPGQSVVFFLNFSAGFDSPTNAPFIFVGSGIQCIFLTSNSVNFSSTNFATGHPAAFLFFLYDASIVPPPSPGFAGTAAFVPSDQSQAVFYDDSIVPPLLGVDNVQAAIDVLKAGGGGGGIGGTIAINEVAVGSGPNTIYGDSRFLWNGATGVLSVNNAGSFFSVNTSTEVLTVASTSSPAVTTIEPNITTISNGVGNVSLLAVGGSGAIGTTGAVPLDILLTDELRINGTPGAAGQVLTSQGAGLPPVWAPGGGGGGIGGTIAVNQVAFGTALNTIGGDARITFNAGTGIFTVDDVGGVFFSVDPASGDVRVDSGVGLLTRVQPNNILLTNGTDDFFIETVAGVGTINALGAAGGALNLSLNELQVNAAPGASGDVLTSQGAGLPPVWSAPAVAPVLTIGEVPGGLVNGANTVFTTAANFTANTTMVYVNGVRQLRGVGNDYTETGPNQITFAVAPLAGFQLQLDYYPV